MTNEYAQIAQMFADKIGPIAEGGFQVIEAQARISGISDLFLYVGMIAAVILGWYFLKKAWKISERLDDVDASLVKIFGTVFYGAFCIIAFIPILVSIEATIAAFYNPKYWAILKIASMVKH